MKAGIKMWGQEIIEAVIKEKNQFYDRNIFWPLLPNEITPEVKYTALGYLMFVKNKRNGTIKVRGCADSRLQHAYKTK